MLPNSCGFYVGLIGLNYSRKTKLDYTSIHNDVFKIMSVIHIPILVRLHIIGFGGVAIYVNDVVRNLWVH